MILDSFRLTGKVALVTGASRGLGASIAVGLAEAGADVALVARGSLDETANEIRKLGRKAVMISADLSTPKKAVPEIMKQVLSEFGKIDILVNGAGMIRRQPALEFSEKIGMK